MAALLCAREKKKVVVDGKRQQCPQLLVVRFVPLWIANDSNPPSGMGSFDKKPENKPK
jgi:hypothetical protein